MRVGERGHARAGVRGPQRDQGAYPAVTAEPLYVITGDEPAQAVADDVDLGVSRPGADLVHPAAEQLGGGPQVAGER